MVMRIFVLGPFSPQPIPARNSQSHPAPSSLNPWTPDFMHALPLQCFPTSNFPGLVIRHTYTLHCRKFCLCRWKMGEYFFSMSIWVSNQSFVQLVDKTINTFSAPAKALLSQYWLKATLVGIETDIAKQKPRVPLHYSVSAPALLSIETTKPLSFLC